MASLFTKDFLFGLHVCVLCLKEFHISPENSSGSVVLHLVNRIVFLSSSNLGMELGLGSWEWKSWNEPTGLCSVP